MTKKQSKELAYTITSDELKQMFLNAQSEIKDWKKVSKVNKGISKGMAFNIMYKWFVLSITTNEELHLLTKTHIIREFGEYLPNYQKPIKQKKYKPEKLIHQEPHFIEE